MYHFSVSEFPPNPLPIQVNVKRGVLKVFGARVESFGVCAKVCSGQAGSMLSSHEWTEKLNALGAARDLAVYDLQLPQGRSGVFRVFLWRCSVELRKEAVTLDECLEFARAMRTIPELRALEAAGAGLEVSTPGVNRTLRSAEHFEAARGEHVEIKYFESDGAKRIRGELVNFCSVKSEVELALDVEAPVRSTKKEKLVAEEMERSKVIVIPLSDVIEAKVDYVFSKNRVVGSKQK